MQLWTKIILGEKILKDNIFKPTVFDYKALRDYLETICNELDEPTPVVLNKHIRHLNEFNNTHFRPEDFVEHVNFDKMVVEIFDEDLHKDKNKK